MPSDNTGSTRVTEDFSRKAMHKAPVNIQKKLTVNTPGDLYEQEADRVAEQVMRMPEPGSASPVGDSTPANRTIAGDGPIQCVCAPCSKEHKSGEDKNRPVEPANLCPKCRSQDERLIQTKPITPLARRQESLGVEEGEACIQRKIADGVSPEVPPAISSGIQSLQDGGRPLSRSERGFFEPRIGADFSGVRVHTGSRASQIAKNLNARAFTIGRNVVFGAGQYQSSNNEGKRLMAHELAHVVQQKRHSSPRSGKNNNAQSSFSVDDAPRDYLQLKRNPDVVHNKYHSFYLLAGGKKEVAVQFYYPGSGNSVTVKMASLRKRSMVQDTYSLSNPSKFSPTIIYEDGVTTIFDLDGDQKGDIEVHVTMNALYSVEFLTAGSSPRKPEYRRHKVRETFAIMKWNGVLKTFKVTSGEEKQAWVIRPHPHPHIDFMYYNTVTRKAFIPSEYIIPSNFKGVRSGQTAIKNKDITILDWGKSWNGFNVTGGVLTIGQIDASSVEGMVDSIEREIGAGDCISTLTIIGHGSPGEISIGDGTKRIEGKFIGGGALDSKSEIYDAKMAGLLARLTPLFCTNGKAVLRGCNVGDGRVGREFTQQLANLWRVDVKAHIGTIRGGGYWTTGKWRQTSPTKETIQ